MPSLLAAIGGIIEKHMIEIGFLEPRQKPEFVATRKHQKGLLPALRRARAGLPGGLRHLPVLRIFEMQLNRACI